MGYLFFPIYEYGAPLGGPLGRRSSAITVMYFSYNGTRDWLKIEWRDQLCMKLEFLTLKINTARTMSRFGAHLRETGPFERVSLAKM